jgi:hypothetical protein
MLYFSYLYLILHSQVRLRSSYENTVNCVAPLLQASLAQRSFMEAYPRLSRQISLDPDWKLGADALAYLLVCICSSMRTSVILR